MLPILPHFPKFISILNIHHHLILTITTNSDLLAVCSVFTFDYKAVKGIPTEKIKQAFASHVFSNHHNDRRHYTCVKSLFWQRSFLYQSALVRFSTFFTAYIPFFDLLFLHTAAVVGEKLKKKMPKCYQITQPSFSVK